MSVKAMLREYIGDLPEDQLFCTRDLLGLCSRQSLDVALSDLVKEEFLERLAQGVFRLRKAENAPVSPLVVAEVKLKAFGKSMFDLPEERRSPVSRKLVSAETESSLVIVGTDGKSSSFRYQGKKIVCLSLGPRKCRLGNGLFGSTLRRLWLLGSGEIPKEQAQPAIDNLLMNQQLWNKFVKFLPDWLCRQLSMAGLAYRPAQVV
ncbi:MAG TPA: hypothetical protein PLC15_02770 [Candidatus Obscuribacter sp.]|nr:hypothetical protein [Candidatus Obscuribacter sp.]HMY02673.1 hypothetical protein [Candidatus Obscuribacter sp.]HMY51571.1 hypothetical protein [Candidatus Obscuribacter sp.]HNA72522.1 hypothetical protein [Candidatus Obscuribacter sp.]HNB14271.1 hypothetical protein [Candidatus Obscuribacter sp.]